jgi:hypothetical protein
VGQEFNNFSKTKQTNKRNYKNVSAIFIHDVVAV